MRLCCSHQTVLSTRGVQQYLDKVQIQAVGHDMRSTAYTAAAVILNKKGDEGRVEIENGIEGHGMVLLYSWYEQASRGVGAFINFTCSTRTPFDCIRAL